MRDSTAPTTHGLAGSRRAVRIVLVGDSTVTDRAGWGHGFRLFLDDGVECVNAAAGGRSSKSYIDEGKWPEALALKGDYYLIQFGHNDQPGKGPERETDPRTTFRDNIARYVDDVRGDGCAANPRDLADSSHTSKANGSNPRSGRTSRP